MSTEETGATRYVYMIRAGHVVKVGCTRTPYSRYKALRPFLAIYGEPRFIGCVEGGFADEKYAYELGEPFSCDTREIRLGSSLPDIGEIFPGREVFPLGSFAPSSVPRERAEVVSREDRRRTPRQKGEMFMRVERLLEEDITRNHACIAQEVGITRERVRQIAAMLGDTGRVRAQLRKEAKFSAITDPPKGFAYCVRRWLKGAGYSYCSTPSHEGGRVMTISEISSSPYQCKRCAAARARELMSRPEMKTKAKIYRRSERGKEVMRKSQAKYYRKRGKKPMNEWTFEDHQARSRKGWATRNKRESQS